MLMFFRCVAEAVVENGVRGLVDMVPGGKYALAVAQGAWKKYRERKKDAEIRAEIQQLAAASFEDARRAAVEAAKEVAAHVPVEDRLTLEMYLSQVPGTVRQSLKRADDVTGRTVPNGFLLGTPDAFARLLPDRALRFKPGDPIAGLDGWALVKPLGSGGFGEVWLARNRTNADESGAVKFCHGQRASDLRHEHALIRRVLATGPHPNIVPLLNANLECEAPWLLYEYVQGTDLGDWVRSLHAQPTEERVRQAVLALRQLCPAIAHFHGLTPAIVHRDLKPSNILVDRVSKRVKVTDFGIGAVAAKIAIEEASEATRAARLTTSLRGAHTPLYASPQQRDGADPDPRDDVHALGVIAYQLLTGQLTQGPGTDFGDDLRERGVDPALIGLIGECVAQNPARRPANASELLERVRALGSTPLAAIPSGPPTTSPAVNPIPVPIPSPPSLPRARPIRRDQDPTARRRAEDNSDRTGVPVWGWVALGASGLLLLCCGAPLGLWLTIHRKNPPEMISDAKTDAQDKKARVPPPADLPAPGGPPAPAPPTLPPAPLPKPASGPKIIPAGADATLVVTQAALAVAEEAAWSSHLEAARNPDAEVSRQGVKGVASFLTHRSEVFRRKAAGALADLGAVAELVATDLREAVKDPDGEVRKSARLALEKIDEAVASAKAAKTRAAVLALAQDLKAKESPKRIKALEQIAAFGPEANNVVGEQLIEALVDKVPGVQKAASDALEKVNPKVHAHVISLLYGMDRSAALSDLGKLGAEAAIAVPLILYLHANPPRTAPKTGSVPGPVCPELATIAKIAPKDKRFAAAVLATIAAPVPRETTGAFVVPDDGGPALGPRATKRVEAIKLLSVIEATPEAKVKAALAALEDGYGAHQVIAALEKMGKDAAPALPALKKLKLSPDDAIRKAVTKAIEKIE